MELLADARALERYIAAGCAATWAWVAIHPETPRLTLLLPLGLAVLGFVRDRSYGLEMVAMSTYLRSAESFFLQPIEGRPVPPKGWEHTHEDMPVSGEPPFVLWAVLFVVALITFFALPAKKIFAPTPPVAVVCSFPPSDPGTPVAAKPPVSSSK